MQIYELLELPPNLLLNTIQMIKIYNRANQNNQNSK